MFPSLTSEGEKNQSRAAIAGNHKSRDEEVAPIRGPQGICEHDGQHGDHAERNGCGAESVGNLKRGRRDVPLLHRVVEGWGHQGKKEGGDHQ